MARTLLDIVQGILSTIDSDTVNSISDTVESDQVADIVRKVYFDIVDEYQLPAQRVITTLEGLSDLSRPNMLKLPDYTQSLLHWQYDTRRSNEEPARYMPIEYRMPADFLKHVNSRNWEDPEQFTTVYIEATVPLCIDKLNPPQFWTSFDDELIVTDNFVQEVDATLQAAKSQAWLEKRHIFMKDDTFVPFLPQNLESLFYRTAENEAYALAKQTVNPKLEQKERRMRIRVQRNKHRTQQTENNFMNGAPNFGRK